LARAIIGPPLLQARDAMGSLFSKIYEYINRPASLASSPQMHYWEISPEKEF
jgi:hypothetical protein